MTRSARREVAASVRLLTLAVLPFLAPAGCSTSEKGSVDGGEAASDVRADTATSPGAPDATPGKADVFAADTAEPRADAVAADAGPVPGDAAAPDTAPARADTAAPETDPVRSEVPAPDAAVARADSAGPEAEASPDAASPDNRRADLSAAEGRGAGPETASSVCTLDGGAASLVRLTPLDLKKLLDSGEDPFLINVKGASIGRIPGTDAVLVDDIPGIEALVGGDHCANIILYCQSGNTSASVGRQLIAKGYARVRDLEGGITAWKNAGYPTE